MIIPPNSSAHRPRAKPPRLAACEAPQITPGHKPLFSQLLSPHLLGLVTQWFGEPLIATMPEASPDADQTAALVQPLAEWQQAQFLLFPETWPGDLDGFFRLRLLQMLDQSPPLNALSVVVLSADLAGQALPAGFADRFRAGWPFARCVFLTERNDHPALSALLGLPVTPLDPAEPAPAIIKPNASQRIAVQVQRAWGRCGNTIMLENQLEDLVKAGFLTIRVFAEASWQRGATLRSRRDALITQNSIGAGAHINVIAVPGGPPRRTEPDTENAWKQRLAATSACRIPDAAIRRVAAQVECAIADSLESVGPAVTLFPQARLLLSVQEDRAVALHHRGMLTGQGETTAMKSAALAARFQAHILAIPDICGFVNETEMTRLAPQCRKAVAVKPHLVRSQTDRATQQPRFDLLIVASEQGLNIVSLRWFLDRVWRPTLEARSVSVAIVGRAGMFGYKTTYASPLLHFLGVVEDLDTVRTWCRLTVVPETGGAGLSMKLLTTIAAGHPLAATRVAFRGLDPAITGLLPAFNAADALAADILDTIDNPENLEQRRGLVQRARDLIGDGTDHAQLAMTVPRPTAPGARKRMTQWSRIVGDAATTPDAAPYTFSLDSTFPMSGTATDPQVLLDGWHQPEPWGRWTDGAEASLRITLAEPIHEPLMLELDIVPSAVAANVRISVDGTLLPLIDPVPGPNGWDIPAELSAGRTRFAVTLHIGETVCPARLGDSPDDRILGIGVAAVRILSRRATLCAVNVPMPVRTGAMPSRVLLTGWHAPEAWGCWTSRTTASLRLTMSEALQTSIRLELDLALPPVHPVLTLSVNGTTLPAIPVADGPNSWDLPPRATNGRSELLVLLTVSKTFNGARSGVSADDRELGIGLRGIRVIPITETFHEPGTPLELAAPLPDQPSTLEETLITGWHPPEEWGAWTSQQHAELRLRLRHPLYGPFRLEMDLMPLPAARGLTLSVNGQPLPMIVPLSGANSWSLPETLSNDQQTLLIGLTVSDTHSPATLSDSPDNRTLGVGVRRLALHREAAAACPVGVPVRISSDIGDRGMLLTGWNNPEPWGCWSSAADASILLRFDTPLQGPCALEFDIAPPLLDPAVTLFVNVTDIGTISAVDGLNEWIIPQSCSDGQTQLIVHLLVPRPACPMEVRDSADDRVLGVGVRSLRLRAVRQD